MKSCKQDSLYFLFSTCHICPFQFNIFSVIKKIILIGFCMSFSRIIVFLGLVGFGLLSRFLPHPPNVTSLNAVALFGVVYFGNRFLSFATIFLTLLMSDFIIGFHSTMPFVYFSFGLVVLLGSLLKRNRGIKQISCVSFLSSCLFFVVTNFGEWMAGSLYPKTMQGLSLCYLAALPFFTTQIFGDFVYCMFLFSLGSFCLVVDNPKDVISH